MENPMVKYLVVVFIVLLTTTAHAQLRFQGYNLECTGTSVASQSIYGVLHATVHFSKGADIHFSNECLSSIQPLALHPWPRNITNDLGNVENVQFHIQARVNGTINTIAPHNLCRGDWSKADVIVICQPDINYDGSVKFNMFIDNIPTR